MIKLFGQTDTTFASNGDLVIQPLKAVVHKEDNGDFYLDLTTSLKYVEDLTEGRIIVAPTPQGEQTFRVGNVQKTKNKLYTRAWHTFYDSENYLIEDSRAVGMTCNAALDHFNTATEPESPFTTLSDVQTVATLYSVRKSLYETIQSVLERWGGHLVRDKFSIQIRENIGQDNGVVVRYGKNLKEITAQYNWDNVVTKLLPTGYDGIMLPEVYLESSQEYALPYTKTVHFDQDIDQEAYKDGDGNLDEEAYNQALIDDLRVQATNYLSTNEVPQANYTLNANLEKITDIGDTVEVIDARLNLNITTNVIAYDYDCILGKYKQLQFGNFKQTLNNLVSNIQNATQEAIQTNSEALQVTLGQEIQAAQDQIMGVLGNSYVIYDGDKILVVDTLPKESATNVIMINSAGIGFSQTGINGTFNSAWTIDGTLNMQAINVINLTADLIKGGTLRLGSVNNQSGLLEVYDEANSLIAELNKDGLKMYGQDGSYVLMNNTVGFAGYDRNGNQIYWVAKDEFHMKKSVVEEEITLCNKLRFIPITITDTNNNIVNDGIGLVSVGGD